MLPGKDDIKQMVKNYPTTSVFVIYNSIIVTLLLIVQIVQHGHP